MPGILSFAGAFKITRFFGAGVKVSLIPAVRVPLYGEAELSYQEYDAYGRIFPLGGALFVGAGVGYATVAGNFTTTHDTSAFQGIVPNLPSSVRVTSGGSVRTMVLIPEIGLQHTFDSGFTLGIDAGAQIPIAPSTTTVRTEVSPPVPPAIMNEYVAPNEAMVEDTLNTIGRQILPTLNVRIGWLL